MLENQEYIEIAILGAGCFWCIETQFMELRGVTKVISGYCNGMSPNPTYSDICTGLSGHAEVAKIEFDPSIISFEILLDVFWTVHDPTTLNRQGGDIGTQYRSAVFYTTDQQKTIAIKSKNEVAPKIWKNKIVTEISPLDVFFEAEDYHQNYYKNNPDKGYCSAVISPKLAKFRKKWKEKLK